MAKILDHVLFIHMLTDGELLFLFGKRERASKVSFNLLLKTVKGISRRENTGEELRKNKIKVTGGLRRGLPILWSYKIRIFSDDLCQWAGLTAKNMVDGKLLENVCFQEKCRFRISWFLQRKSLNFIYPYFPWSDHPNSFWAYYFIFILF